ncbi:hypothetical protein NQ317_013954 [Molorchus minor]|uniref:Uncharacterized protein n=1 Tax=Molorchus minor TaxID=1323400 RepID=A0ABQ9JW62_9CUCU|nr:hypothetical protein NQ317_013954 [Molorchus minor]
MFGETRRLKAAEQLLTDIPSQDEIIDAELVRDRVVQRLECVTQQALTNFNKKRVLRSAYAVGDRVAVQNMQLATGGKLKPKFQGSFEVVYCLDNERYALRRIDDGRRSTVAAHEQLRTWPDRLVPYGTEPNTIKGPLNVPEWNFRLLKVPECKFRLLKVPECKFRLLKVPERNFRLLKVPELAKQVRGRPKCQEGRVSCLFTSRSRRRHLDRLGLGVTVVHKNSEYGTGRRQKSRRDTDGQQLQYICTGVCKIILNRYSADVRVVLLVYAVHYQLAPVTRQVLENKDRTDLTIVRFRGAAAPSSARG